MRHCLVRRTEHFCCAECLVMLSNHAMNGMELIRATRGLSAKVARELGLTRGAIAQWNEVPPERVPEVSRISGIPRHQLRPDLWEPPFPANDDPEPPPGGASAKHPAQRAA